MLPIQSGYYMTQYTNLDDNGRLYFKAIWFNADKQAWMPWRIGQDAPRVFSYVADSRHDYYVACVMAVEERIGAGEELVYTAAL